MTGAGLGSVEGIRSAAISSHAAWQSSGTSLSVSKDMQLPSRCILVRVPPGGNGLCKKQWLNSLASSRSCSRKQGLEPKRSVSQSTQLPLSPRAAPYAQDDS